MNKDNQNEEKDEASMHARRQINHDRIITEHYITVIIVHLVPVAICVHASSSSSSALMLLLLLILLLLVLDVRSSASAFELEA